MSYDINIWNPKSATLPEKITYPDVGSVLTSLSQQPSSPEDRLLFAEFGRRLKNQYPNERVKSTAEDLFLDDLEIDGGSSETALWRFAIYGDDRGEVLVDVSHQARSIGLVFYDDQIGLGIDENGDMFPEERANELLSPDNIWNSAIESKHVTTAYLEKNLINKIKNKLEAIGFIDTTDKYGNSCHQRENEEVCQTITFTLISRGNDEPTRLALRCLISIPEIYRLEELICGDAADALFSFSLTEFSHPADNDVFESETESRQAYFMKSTLPTYEDFETTAQISTFLDMFETRLIPVLDRSQSIIGVSELTFTDAGQKLLPANIAYLKKVPFHKANDYLYRKCILAGLARGARFKEVMMSEWQARCGKNADFHQEARQQMKKILEYFKNPGAFEKN
jgi:hypothetical protein